MHFIVVTGEFSTDYFEEFSIGLDKEEIQILKDEIRYFEEKYGGPFEKTLGAKRELSSDEERDAVEWESLLRSLERRIKCKEHSDE